MSRRPTARSAPSRSADLASGQFIADMGLLGPKVMLPVGVIAGVDEQTRTIRLDRTKDEVKSAPEFDGASVRVLAYRAKLENY